MSTTTQPRIRIASVQAAAMTGPARPDGMVPVDTALRVNPGAVRLRRSLWVRWADVHRVRQGVTVAFAGDEIHAVGRDDVALLTSALAGTLASRTAAV